MYISEHLQIENLGKTLRVRVGRMSSLHTVLTLSEVDALIACLNDERPKLAAANQGDIEKQRVELAEKIEQLTAQLKELDAGISVSAIRV